MSDEAAHDMAAETPASDPAPGSARRFDLVLFGATGFTGGLTAAHLAANAPAGCRWALAGRDQARLAAVRAALAADHPEHPELADLPLLPADSGDPAALRALAEQTRVLISTVGPYAHHGEPLVAACAAAGTDYLDLTGEPEFVDRMYLLHHATAVQTGARLVHACGFDSVPHDLGALFTVQQFPDDVAIRMAGFVRASGGISGGTLASALLAFSDPRSMQATAKRRRAADPRPPGRSIGSAGAKIGRDKDAHAWVVPLPTIDPQIVLRSAAALPEYGPEFRYSHYAAVKRLPVLLAGGLVVAAVALAAQVPPLRRALSRVIKPGDGPSPEQRAKGWFTVRFAATGGGRHVVTEVSGGDPGYGDTAKMLGQAALCLAFDDLPPTAGQVTTATAMGGALIDRLHKTGITFTVLDRPPHRAPGRGWGR